MLTRSANAVVDVGKAQAAGTLRSAIIDTEMSRSVAALAVTIGYVRLDHN